MNRRLLNNEISCTVLRIHQRYFNSDKYSVQIFNAYMQEFNLKFYNFQFILLMFLFRVRCINRKFQLQDLWSCALAWWCQKNHRTSHIRHLLNTSLTTFFFSPLAFHTQHFSCVPITNKTDQTLLSAVPLYRLAPSFPIYLSRGRIGSLYMIFS
jgi:hypothetical protein